MIDFPNLEGKTKEADAMFKRKVRFTTRLVRLLECSVMLHTIFESLGVGSWTMSKARQVRHRYEQITNQITSIWKHIFGNFIIIICQVDIVVLNAGRSQRAEWTDIDPSVDAECFQINAIGPTQVARTILKSVIYRKPNKLFVSGIAGCTQLEIESIICRWVIYRLQQSAYWSISVHRHQQCGWSPAGHSLAVLRRRQSCSNGTVTLEFVAGTRELR